jgi:hypothetical protein
LSALFLFSDDLNTNVDFSDFICLFYKIWCQKIISTWWQLCFCLLPFLEMGWFERNYLKRAENTDCIHTYTYIYISSMIILFNTKYNVYIEFKQTLTVTFSSHNILMCTFPFFRFLYDNQIKTFFNCLFYCIALLLKVCTFFFTYDDHNK